MDRWAFNFEQTYSKDNYSIYPVSIDFLLIILIDLQSIWSIA